MSYAKSDMVADYSRSFSRLNPGGLSHNSYTSARAYYIAEILQILPKDKTAAIVDVGTGYGYLLRYLLEIGYKNVGGIDESPLLLQAVKKKLGDKLVFLKHEDAKVFLSKNKSQFDLITLFDVVEHFPLEGAKNLMMLTARALKPGGMVIIRTPNMANILGTYSRYIDLTHYHCYTEFSLTELLLQAGFNKVTLQPPCWQQRSRRIKKFINDWFHEKLYRLHDRVMPACFDKNIVMWAKK